MNVYTCWYRGNFGYGCRRQGRKWMFVPELGQQNHEIYRNLHLDDLVFKNPFDKKFELSFENRMRQFSVLRLLKKLFTTGQKVHTVGGLLFTTN